MSEDDKKNDITNCIAKKDLHILRLLNWIRELRQFSIKVRDSDMDHELEDEILEIIKRLINEVGHRMTNIFS